MSLGLSFPPWNQAWLAFIAIAPLGVALRVRSRPLAIGGAFAFSLSQGLLGLDWMRACHAPQRWFGPVAESWLLTAEFSTLGVLTSVALGRLVATLWPRLPMTWLLPLVWASGEALRSAAWYLVTGQSFPWLQTAIPLVSFSAVSQLAAWGGAPLLALVVGAVNGAVFDLLAKVAEAPDGGPWRPVLRRCALLAAVLAGAMAVEAHRAAQLAYMPGPNVVLAPASDAAGGPSRGRHNTDFPLCDVALFPELALEHEVWPQDGTGPDRPTSAMSLDSLAASPLGTIAVASRGVVIIGCVRVASRGSGYVLHNSLVALSSKSPSSPVVYDKEYPVPFREYWPTWWPGSADSTIQHVHPGQRRRSIEVPVARSGGRVRAGLAVCYDIAFPDHFASEHGEPVGLFLCASHEPPTWRSSAQQTLLRMAQLRAIERRCTIVRNVTNGLSGIVEPTGRVRQAGDVRRARVLLREVPVCEIRTLYDHGGWALRHAAVLALAVLSAVAILPGSRRFR